METEVTEGLASLLAEPGRFAPKRLLGRMGWQVTRRPSGLFFFLPVNC